MPAAAACVLSAAIGFYAGKLMRSPERAANASSEPSVKVSAEKWESPPKPAGVPDEAGVSAGPASVTEIILGARALLLDGLDGSRLPDLVRALEPLAALDSAALRAAVDEVKRMVTESKLKLALFSMLLGCWAERDGRAALAFAQAEAQQPMMAGLENQVLGVWAEREPDAAWAWFLKARAAGGDSVAGGPERYLQSLFGALASSNVADACARIRELSPHEQFTAGQGMTGAARDTRTREALLVAAPGFDPEERRMVYANVLGDWGLSDPDAATAWLEALPAADRTDAAREVGREILTVDPPRAAALMVRNAADDRSLANAYSGIGGVRSIHAPLRSGSTSSRPAQRSIMRGSTLPGSFSIAMPTRSLRSLRATQCSKACISSSTKRMRLAPSKRSKAPACPLRWPRKSAKALGKNKSLGRNVMKNGPSTHVQGKSPACSSASQ